MEAAMSLSHRLPACVALLLLGALSLRLGFPFLLAVPMTLLLLVLVFIPQAWIQITLMATLALGTLGWIAMLVVRVQERMALGEPWTRLAIILGAVALFTAWSAWLLRRPGRQRA
jgi:hypothetical protein